MTELAPLGTMVHDDLRDGAIEFGSSGTLFGDTEAKIVHVLTGEDQHYEMEGELLIRGPQVMKG